MKSLVLAIGLLAGIPAYSADMQFQSELEGFQQQQSTTISRLTQQRVSELVMAPLTGTATADMQENVAAAMLPTSSVLRKIDPALLQLSALADAEVSGSY